MSMLMPLQGHALFADEFGTRELGDELESLLLVALGLGTVLVQLAESCLCEDVRLSRRCVSDLDVLHLLIHAQREVARKGPWSGCPGKQAHLWIIILQENEWSTDTDTRE